MDHLSHPASPDVHEDPEARIRSLEDTVARLTKTNGVLMRRVEEGVDQAGAEYSLFLTATVLEQRIKERTEAVGEALRRLEVTNRDLLEAKEAAESALLAKDVFLASMSHELRTPLNAVLGHAETLLEELLGPLTQAQRASLSMIDSSSRHLLALINDILDITKVHSGEAALNTGEIDLEEICEESIATVAIDAVKKGIRLRLEMHPREIEMWADGRRVKQMLLNLLGNAIKFTPDGGDVALRVFGEASEQTVRIEVHDTGIGIAPEDIDRLFEPFVQLDGGLSRGYDGSGLGLTIVKEMATLHGGSASVQSEVGEGSIFIVSLPRKAARTAEAPSPEPHAADVVPQSEPVKQTILLAEDNEANIGMVEPYLVAKGYAVLVARDGAEAVRAAKSGAPDLILMDVQMPGMDGLTATRSIRSDTDIRDVPIIALTALAMPGDRDRCFEAGVDDYVTKPVGLKSLVATIQRHLVAATTRSGAV